MIFLFLIYCASLFACDYQVGIAMIFRNEGPYLKEWIEYHRIVGVDHFWLFNNLSQDNFREVLQPYIDADIVELFDVPIDSPTIQRWNVVQTRTYNRALNYARGKCRWLAAIDADEFIVPIDCDTISQALEPFLAHPAVALHWMIFGTSLIEKIPPDQLMLESLTMRGAATLEENSFVKLIVNPVEAIAFDGPHMCAFIHHTAVNTNQEPVQKTRDSHITHNHLRINHYWSRDLDFLKNVKLPRSKISGGTWADHMERELHQFNTIQDDAIFRFLPRLREALASAIPDIDFHPISMKPQPLGGGISLRNLGGVRNPSQINPRPLGRGS